MKIDSIDKVTSFDSPVSEPLGNEDKSIMTTKKTAGLSDLNYTPYKPVNITGQAKKAYNYYLNRGVKPNVAAGIVGNLYKESGLNPMAVGDKGTAFGVAQWRGDRLSNLKKYASSKGRSYTDLNTQLDFILDERGENQVLSLMGNQSPEEAAKTFADKYERPNPKYADYSTRSSVAKQLGQMKYGGSIPRLQVGGKTPRYKPLKYKYDNKGRKIALLNDKNEVIREIDPATGRPKYGNPFKEAGKLLGESLGEVKTYLGKTYDKDGVLGVVDEVMSAPARGVTKLITGKYQDPSTALDIKNPYAKLAVDMILDPTNLLPTSVITKGLKVAKGAKAMKMRRVIDPVYEAMRQNSKRHNIVRRFLQEGDEFTKMRKYVEDKGLFNAGSTKYIYERIEEARKMSKADPLKAGSALINDLINIDKPDSNKPTINNNPNIIFNTVNSNTPNRKKLPSLSNNTTAVQNKPQYSIPKSTEVQNTNSIVKPEASIDSVSLPSEEIYKEPIPQKRPRRHTESIQDYEDSFKSKPKTSGQQNYELNSDYVQRLHQENVKGTKMKPKLIRNAFGGFIPKYALGAGAIMGLVSQGMGLVSQGLNFGAGFIDSTNDPENPNVAKSAISGFLKGNAALPGIGGILGGIAGIRDAKKQRELFQKKKDIENRGVMDYFNIRSKGILDNYNTQGEQSSFYAKGGIPNPQYEVEHGEVIIGDDVKLTGGKQLASNLHKVVGKTHDQFNPNTVNGTGEDGQGGQFIFSNRLRLGGKTFAKLAEGVAKQKAKAEEMMSHNDYIFKNTGQANAEIADAKLMQLAQIQEMVKGETNALGQFKFGGKVSKYPEGKNLTEDKGIVEGRNFLTNWYKKRNLVTKPIDISKSLDYVKDDLPGFVKADGLYNPINNKAHFNETKPVTASLATHEFTHAIDDKYGDNINFKDSPYEYNKKVLKTDYTSLGVKPIEGSLNTYGNLTYDYVTKPEETYARLNELRQSSGHEPNKVVTTDDIKKLKRNNDLFMFYSDEDIMKMWNGLSSKNRKSSFPNQLNSGLRKAKFGGSIPQYVGGGELTAEQAYEQAYKNLERAAKARAGKAANQAAKAAAEAAYESAYQAERKLASKVGESVVKRTASRLGGIAAESLGMIGKVGGIYATMATELAGDVSPTQSKPKEKSISPSVLNNLQKQGFTPDKVNVNSKVNPNKLTIPEHRALRNAIPTSTPSAPTTPQGTNKLNRNKLNLNKTKVNPVINKQNLLNSLPIQDLTNNSNIIAPKDDFPTIQLPQEEIDYSSTVKGNNNFSPIRKVGEKGSGINTDDLAPVAGALMNGINYFANQNMINKYKTQTPASLLQNPNYQYFDRSGTARNSVRGITNTIMNNPFLNQGTKQAALANYMNVMNDVNQEELNRKQEYDRTYRTQQLETENRNAMILNQARQQTMQNENQKQGLRQDNLNNLFSNVNTNLAEFQANKQQDKAMLYMSLPYFKRLGLLTKEQQAEFMKNLTSFLMGESEVPKNKKGGRIKMKYC